MSSTCTHCHQKILLRPEERDVCAACEKRGGPPPVTREDVLQAAAGLPPEIYEALFCERDDCDNAILPMEETDRYEPPTLTREQRRERGLRTECGMHAKESVHA